MWHTSMRSVNARTVKASDFTLLNQPRGSLLAYLQATPFQPHPGMIQVQPERTKTQLQNPFQISIPLAEEPVINTYFWLLSLSATAPLAGQPITNQLVRSSKPLPHALMHGPQFSDQALSRSGLYDRLVARLKEIRAYNGESLHSFRRGMAQYRTAAGQSPEQVMDQMLLKTRRILDTVYLPCSRHLSGIKRMRQEPARATPSTL